MQLKEPEICPGVIGSDPCVWYAMSAPYRRERIACSRFEDEGLECYLPLRETLVRDRNGKSRIKEIPAVSNLFFVRGTRSMMRAAKPRVAVAQYLTRREGDRNVPITVPDSQMANFRLASERGGDKTLYLDPSEIDIKKGTKVRIVGGMLDGLEGRFMKVKGSRSRRLVVILDGVTAVAAEVEPDFIQILD